MLPQGDRLTLDDGDCDRVGQTALDGGAGDPGQALDPPAHAFGIEGQDGIAALQARGGQQRLGIGLIAPDDLDILDAEPGRRRTARWRLRSDFVADGLQPAGAPAAGRSGR